MYYKQELEEIKEKLEEQKADMLKQLEVLPEGSLLIYEKRGKKYYCQRLTKQGNRKKEHRISINDDTGMIFALTRKRYLELALDNLDNNIAVMEKAVAGYIPYDEVNIMDDYLERNPELSDGIYYGLRNPEKWESAFVPDENFFAEDLKSVSRQGEMMRSGGEMYIASRLDHYIIPYRYEAPTGIPDIGYIPDFTIMRPRDRKIIYWEHFGKVDDEEYIERSLQKVSKYIEYGICPWDNLIITYNNKSGGFDGRHIDAAINSWLL